MNAEPDYDDLDPNIREVVRFLRKHGFCTTDSGDGRAKGEDGMPWPHVFCVVEPREMVFEADRLFSLCRASGIPIGANEHDDPDDMTSPHVYVSYDPGSTLWKKAIIGLVNVTDDMLPRTT